MDKIRHAWRGFRALPKVMQFGAWLALAILLMLAWPKESRADAIARQGSDWVRLTLKPCADEQVVAVLASRGQQPESYRAAIAHFQGQDFAACWQPAPGGAVLVYGDGDGGFVGKDELKPVPEA
jgi:hypothetical protein